MFCYTLRYVHSSIAIILMEKRELSLFSWCLVIVVWFFLAVPWGCLRFVIVVFPDHTHLLLLRMGVCPGGGGGGMPTKVLISHLLLILDY